jgi:hypothetical protein
LKTISDENFKLSLMLVFDSQAGWKNENKQDDKDAQEQKGKTVKLLTILIT